jgi:hypothetical protein
MGSEYFRIFARRGGRSFAVNDFEIAGFPGVKCGLCGAQWAGVGLWYPTEVDASRLLPPPCNVPVGQYLALRERVYAEAGRPPARCLPGTLLGPLRGRARGTFVGASIVQWSLVVRRSLAERLGKEFGVRFGEFQIENRAEDLVVLEALPEAHFAEYPPGPVCGRCGRNASPHDIPRDQLTVTERPAHALCRGYYATTVLVVSARFKAVLSEHADVSQLRFEPIAGPPVPEESEP